MLILLLVHSGCCCCHRAPTQLDVLAMPKKDKKVSSKAVSSSRKPSVRMLGTVRSFEHKGLVRPRNPKRFLIVSRRTVRFAALEDGTHRVAGYSMFSYFLYLGTPLPFWGWAHSNIDSGKGTFF